MSIVFKIKKGAITLKRTAKGLCMMICMVIAMLLITKTDAFASTYGDYQYTVSGKKIIITKYTGNASKVYVPNVIKGKPVTEIAKGAFKWCTGIKEVKIYGKTKTIGKEAFAYCYNLKKVTMLRGVENIGTNAFAYCAALNTVNMHKGIKTVSTGAFKGCRELTGIELPKGTKSIGSNTFAYCS